MIIRMLNRRLDRFVQFSDLDSMTISAQSSSFRVPGPTEPTLGSTHPFVSRNASCDRPSSYRLWNLKRARSLFSRNHKSILYPRERLEGRNVSITASPELRPTTQRDNGRRSRPRHQLTSHNRDRAPIAAVREGGSQPTAPASYRTTFPSHHKRNPASFPPPLLLLSPPPSSHPPQRAPPVHERMRKTDSL